MSKKFKFKSQFIQQKHAIRELQFYNKKLGLFVKKKKRNSKKRCDLMSKNCHT